LLRLLIYVSLFQSTGSELCFYVTLLLRRFGESDADLSLEDKMFLRFQKERVKKARNVSLFNLEGSDNVLTHKGYQTSQHFL
jgi:Nop14-like family